MATSFARQAQYEFGAMVMFAAFSLVGSSRPARAGWSAFATSPTRVNQSHALIVGTVGRAGGPFAHSARELVRYSGCWLGRGRNTPQPGSDLPVLSSIGSARGCGAAPHRNVFIAPPLNRYRDAGGCLLHCRKRSECNSSLTCPQ